MGRRQAEPPRRDERDRARLQESMERMRLAIARSEAAVARLQAISARLTDHVARVPGLAEQPAVARLDGEGGGAAEAGQTATRLVVIAASAGGLTPIADVLAGLPPECPAAVLVVQHHDPRHPSLLADILRSRTGLPVEEARDGERLRPGVVRVAPPDRYLLVEPGGRLRLRRSELTPVVCRSADLLFRSAADAYGARVVAVVLSGTGADGSRGAVAVRDAGGTVIAQDEATSEFFGMPRAAIRTGAVALVLPAGEIGAAAGGPLAG